MILDNTLSSNTRTVWTKYYQEINKLYTRYLVPRYFVTSKDIIFDNTILNTRTYFIKCQHVNCPCISRHSDDAVLDNTMSKTCKESLDLKLLQYINWPYISIH